jgi:hypothetical protein
MKGSNITERAGYAQPLQWPGYDQICKGVIALEHYDPSGKGYHASEPSGKVDGGKLIRGV